MCDQKSSDCECVNVCCVWVLFTMTAMFVGYGTFWKLVFGMDSSADMTAQTSSLRWPQTEDLVSLVVWHGIPDIVVEQGCYMPETSTVRLVHNLPTWGRTPTSSSCKVGREWSCQMPMIRGEGGMVHKTVDRDLRVAGFGRNMYIVVYF